MHIKKLLEKPCMAIIALIAWFGLGLQLYIMLDQVPGNGLTIPIALFNFFSYFTVLTNIIVATSLTVSLLAPSSAAGQFFLKPSVRTAIALYITVVGITYSVLLRNIWNPTGLQLVADRLLHDAVPMLALLFWVVFIPKKTLEWKNAFPWFIYPVAYLVYALIRGAVSGWFAYYFLNYNALGWSKTFLYILLVTAVFVVLGFLFIALNRAMKRD